MVKSNGVLFMKHDKDNLFQWYKDMLNQPDIRQDYIGMMMRKYAEHQATPLLADIAAKDARIAALEEALKFSHAAAVRLERKLAYASGNVFLEGAANVFNDVIPEHPLLLKDRSRLLAEVAKVDGEYL